MSTMKVSIIIIGRVNFTFCSRRNLFLDNLATRGERLELLVDKTEDLEANVSWL